MASFSLCSVGIAASPSPSPSPSPSRVVIASHHPSFHLLKPRPKVFPVPFSFRFKSIVRFQIRERSFSGFASNSNPSGEDSLQEKSSETKTSDAGQGPPFLTISAALLVFFLICWTVGSAIIWFVGLIVRLLPK